MSKVIICDICKQPIKLCQRQYKITIKKEMFSINLESWFEKLDICEDCADKIIYECRKEKMDADSN